MELCCTLLNYVVPSEQCCTLQRHGALYWAILHLTELRCVHSAALRPIELRCTLLSYTAPPYDLAHPYWATLHPAELRWTLLSYAEPYWAMLNPTVLRCSLLSYAALCELHYILTEQPSVLVPLCNFFKCQNAWLCRYCNKCTPVWYRNAMVPDWDAGCQNTDDGGIGLDADAQLWYFQHSFVNCCPSNLLSG